MNRRRLGQEVAAMAECLETAGYNGLTKQGHEQFIKEMREIADELSSSYDVHLTYLKKSGKYYSEGMYTTRKEHMHQIFEEVRELTQRGELPGLVQG